MQPEGKRAGKGAQTHPHGENNRPHQRFDGADDVQRRAHHVIDGARHDVGVHQVAGGKETERDGKDNAEDRREEGQRNRLAHLLQDQRQRLGHHRRAKGPLLDGADGVGLCLPGSGALGHRHCLGDAYRLGESSARVGREDDLLPLARDALDIAYRVQPAQLALNVGKEATTNDRDRIADVGARRAENNPGSDVSRSGGAGIDTGDLNRPDANSVIRWAVNSSGLASAVT